MDFYRQRIARWSKPRYALDSRFVNLTLLLDQGPDAQGPRWQSSKKFQSLSALLTETTEPLVILGAPGCGKSTLLRHYELENAQTALAELQQNASAKPPLTFFIQLNDFKSARPGGPAPLPLSWLAERWSQQNPDLPQLKDLLKAGRITLLLDALNEMPYRNAEVIGLWKDFLAELENFQSNARVIFSCRSLDYSAVLSSKDRPVPQVRIESLSDDDVQNFLLKYSPEYGEVLWRNLNKTAQLELFRSPYFLKMLIDESSDGNIPNGRAALFTAFVCRLLQREIDANHPLFRAGELLTEADIHWLIHRRQIDQSSCDLPEHGLLLVKLGELAYRMQRQQQSAESGLVKISYEQALKLIAQPVGEHIVNAGLAMDVLEKEPGSREDQLFYLHQLIQEYFAARCLAARICSAKAPSIVDNIKASFGVVDLEIFPLHLAKQQWKSSRVSPSLKQTLNTLQDSDPLPPLPATGWEETLVLAGTMLANADDFIRQLMAVNLALAGRCAAQPGMAVSQRVKEQLQQALITRSQNPRADLRARIAAADALGELGDPRFQKCNGPDGPFLLPPLIDIPGGTYTIGSNEGLFENESPQHPVTLGTFQMGQFPVTNAEWRLFVAAGGYDDERWWSTAAAKTWLRDENTGTGPKQKFREFRKFLQNNSSNIRQSQDQGEFTSNIAQWSDEAFEEMLITMYPCDRLIEPAYWRDDNFNRPAQPVVAICWYEALAYCSWLSAQGGLVFRLPSEAEWEAAARGLAMRRYAYGERFDSAKANTFESHIRTTTPIGVFPGGNTPEGLCDMTGNVWEWTSSLYRDYRYDPNDGRENLDDEGRRVARGGSWHGEQDFVHRFERAAFRGHFAPSDRFNPQGFRLVCSSPIV